MQNQGYSRTAVFLHWTIAVSIFFLFISSWWMLGLPLPSKELQFRAFPFQLHKNIGITLVLLLFILLYVRFKHRPAPVESSMKPWMHKLALADHVLLYVLILATCVTGYLSSAHTKWDTVFWWVIEFPRIAAPNEDMNEFWGELHLWTAWALLALVAVHISGAVYHAFINDGIVRRMMRW
ncbi:cytochrome b561 [Methylohalomonas lacus]|uniref:Cytochrome b561 n=1 Tax=Methylohalomonas lacus TaxID=398773 RepID=A0AAE3HLD8_9GAMM|nr:cytochrome b [Methylohalomonas lacus]MCS3902563.1 cytochrome b561 [Methylohalomonas lacus]